MFKPILLFPALLLISIASNSQKVSGKITLEQGRKLAIHVDVKNTIAQQAMGQAIDFTANGAADHSYTVTNSTADNSTLHHQVERFVFDFDGMGQKRKFDSDNKKDIDGPLGKPIKEMLGKTFDLIIDPFGRTLLVKPEKLTLTEADERFAIIANMLKDLTSVIYPPKKGKPSFFNLFPGQEVTTGDSWKETIQEEGQTGTAAYTLTGITDSTLVVDFKTQLNSESKGAMMGMETTTKLKSVATGQIIVNKASGIIMTKNYTVESNGATEAMGNSMPINVKTVIAITVTQQ